jgi:hypothetical protein
LKNFDREYGEHDKLERFFGVLRQFNHGQDLDSKFVKKMRKYFDYKWNKDRNFCIKTKEDTNILG